MFNKFSKLISPNQETVLRVMNFCQSCPGRRSNRTYVDMCRQAVAVVASVLDFGALWAGMAGGRPLGLGFQAGDLAERLPRRRGVDACAFPTSRFLAASMGISGAN